MAKPMVVNAWSEAKLIVDTALRILEERNKDSAESDTPYWLVRLCSMGDNPHPDKVDGIIRSLRSMQLTELKRVNRLFLCDGCNNTFPTVCAVGNAINNRACQLCAACLLEAFEAFEES